MTRDAWNPDQYERFHDERTQPFHDLLALVAPVPGMRAVDLGCGTGELTRVLHDRLAPKETLGLDSSAAMRAKSTGFEAPGLRFQQGEIESFEAAAGSLELIFSNAALHWVDDHPGLFARLAAQLAERGQLAVQMPANHDHPSHTVAHELAREPPFREALGGWVRSSPVLAPEAYATLLFALGFREQRVFLRVYAHVLDSSEGVVEWVRGTTLTVYEKRLGPALYAEFLSKYRARLLNILEDRRPYLFPFKRVLLWGRL